MDDTVDRTRRPGGKYRRLAIPWHAPRGMLGSGGGVELVAGVLGQGVATRLLRRPRTAEVLAFEPGCEQYLEREIDDIE